MGSTIELQWFNNSEHPLREVSPYLTKNRGECPSFPTNDLPVKITRVFDSGEHFPDGFLELYATFSITATGGRVDYDRCFVQDGKLWAWMEFED